MVMVVKYITDKELLNIFTNMVRAQTAYIDRQLSFLNLSNGQGGVIMMLGRHGCLTQNELARFRQVTPATISIMLDRMERDGLVVRSSPEGNNRVKNVMLTEKGKEVYKQLDKFMEREPAVVFKGLTEEEKKIAATVFQKITKNVMK
jgi:DNA-binding MarR family transcriptional regulator